MSSRKFRIWPILLVCCVLVMATSCDTTTDEAVAVTETVADIEEVAEPETVAITSFKVGQDEGVIDEKKTPKTIKITVPYGTDLETLTPEIVFSGRTVSPTSGARVDFSDSVKNPVNYMVIGRDGSTVEYQVTAQAANGSGMVINVTLDDNTIATAPPVTTIYKNGNPTSVTIEAAKGISCKWYVDGKLCGTSNSIMLDSANLTTGDHFVTLIATKNGIPYSREFIITVIRQFR